MPTNYQSNSNAVVSYKAQAGRGQQAAGAGGTILRTAGGNGGKLTKAAIESNAVRADGMRTRGRHGSQKTAGDYVAELSLGSHDQIVEAIMRGTWDNVALSATEADMTSVTTAANAINATAGSFLAKGFKVGDVIRAANLPDAANNGRNLRVTSVSALSLGIAETLTVNNVADTAFTLTRPGKRVIQPPALVKRYFTIDEHEVDIDQSTVLTDFVWSSLKISMGSNGLVMFDPGGVGTGRLEALATGASPLLTNPGEPVDAPMSVVDATIRFGGADLVELTSFDINIDIGATAPDVFGSGQIRYSPDVFTGQMGIGINLGMLRKDLAVLQDFINETPLELHVLCVDNTSEPKDFMSVFIPNFTLGGVDPTALSKQGGGRTQTITIPPALVGKDNRGAGFDPTMIRFQTTAAA